MHLSLPKHFPLFILASSVCKSLHSLISALTQGGGGGHLFRLTCSAVLWGGRNTANITGVWGVLAVSGPHWVCSHSLRVCFPGLHGSGFRLLCSGSVLSRLWVPRSKPLRFSFLGTPQRHRLSWARVLCTSHMGSVCSPSTWMPELLGPGKGTKRRPNQICAFVEYPRN